MPDDPTCDIYIQINENGAYRCGKPAIGCLIFSDATIYYCAQDEPLIDGFKQMLVQRGKHLVELSDLSALD